MITISLMGGTANQLFQWAFGRSLMQNDSVQFDVSHFDGDSQRMFMLDQIGLNLPLVKGLNQPIIREGSMRFNPGLLDVKNASLVGYFQSEQFFLRVKDQIRNEVFQRPSFYTSDATNAVAAKIRSYSNSAFLHVRRSDNLSKRAVKFHGMLTSTYYQDAQDYIRARVPGVHFFVFSDDPAWCHENFKGPGYTVVDHNPMSGTWNEDAVITKKAGGREVEDLWLMSLCRHKIVANSTFSWWSCWLGEKQSEEQIAIAPRNDLWFVPTPNGPDATDIIPERWVRL